MKLPVLKPPKEGDELDASTCHGKDHCSECSLYVKNDGRCDGCTPMQKSFMEDTNFEHCYRECHECTGFKVNVTGVCCRSPLKDVYMTAVTKGAADWNAPEFEFEKRPPLTFKQKAIFYISSGGISTMTAGGHQLVPDDHEVAAVNLSRVWGKNGFYSKDLKDYLHMSPNTKLILLTMTLDDLLERAWEHEFYADPEAYTAANIDYWMPLQFSAYRNEARMHQYYQYLRTLYAHERSKAWFASGDHFYRGFKTDDLYLQTVAAVPQITLNMQFLTNEANWKWHLAVLKHYHEITSRDVAFFCVGTGKPTFLHNARRMCGKRDMYFLSAQVFYLATKGHELRPSGKSRKSDKPKLELAHENFNTFAAMVKKHA